GWSSSWSDLACGVPTAAKSTAFSPPGPGTAADGWVESPPFWQPARAKTGIETNDARIDFQRGCIAMPPCWREFFVDRRAYHPHNGRFLQWRLPSFSLPTPKWQ